LANTPVQDSSGWITILRKLGITGITKWSLSDTVVPVALVDSEVTLNASASTPLVNVPASAGEQAVPAANTRLANTGPLPAGPYTMVFWIGTNEANAFRVRRRNAADSADIWAQRFAAGVGQGPGFTNFGLRLILAANEFVVIENVGIGGAGTVYQASIFVSAG
jgi:hypothetical protein